MFFSVSDRKPVVVQANEIEISQQEQRAAKILFIRKGKK